MQASNIFDCYSFKQLESQNKLAVQYPLYVWRCVGICVHNINKSQGLKKLVGKQYAFEKSLACILMIKKVVDAHINMLIFQILF